MMVSKIWFKLGEFIGNTIINKIPSRSFRKLWFLAFGAQIKRKTVIYRNTEILKINGLKIGERTQIGWHCLLDARGG